MIERRARTADGVSLALYRLDPARAGGVPVLLVHGAFTSHRVWLRADGGLADFLAAAGFDVWLADLRHHGASEREPRPRAWRFEDLILHDAPALVAAVGRETGGRPIGWIGHSIGGVVGLCSLARRGADGVGTVVLIGVPGPHGLGALRWALSAATIGVCRLLGRYPARALRQGSEDEPGHVFGDWMSWNLRGRWVGRDGYDYLEASRRVRVPLLAVTAEADRLFAPPRACRQVVDAVGAERKALVVCGSGLTHRGLVLDAAARECCWPRVRDWLEATAPAP